MQPCAIAAQHDERQAGAVYDNNRRVSHSVVRQVDRSDIPPATFELPSGYTKQDIMRRGGNQN